jgi:hypothetical protein
MSRPASKVTKVRVTGPLAPFAAGFGGRLLESGYTPLSTVQSPGRARQHPAERLPQAAVQPGHAVPGPRPGLLRPAGQHPPADRPPRRQARRPRLRSHPLPPPRTRTRRLRQHPGRVTARPSPAGQRAGSAGAAARPADLHFSGQPHPMEHCIFWRLGFRQSSFRHVARVSQRIAPYAWTRPLVGCHAAVPLTFRRQVRHQTQEHPTKFLPATQGIR